MKQGWVKLHRQLIDWPWFKSPEWLSVWVYLLLNATHQPRKMNFDGKTVELQPGQLITGRHAIAEATGVHNSKVKRILNNLKTDQQIDQQAGVKGSIITVRNWRAYQGDDQQIDQRLTSKRPATDQRLTTNKNVENGKNGRQHPSAHAGAFAEFWIEYPKKTAKGEAEKAFAKIPDVVALLPRILTAIRTQKQSRDWKKERGQFIPHPATWLNRKQWEDEPTTQRQAPTVFKSPPQVDRPVTPEELRARATNAKGIHDFISQLSAEKTVTPPTDLHEAKS